MRRHIADSVVLRILTASRAMERGGTPVPGTMPKADEIAPDYVKAGLQPIEIAEEGLTEAEAPQPEGAGLPAFDGTGADLNTMLNDGPMTALLEGDDGQPVA